MSESISGRDVLAALIARAGSGEIPAAPGGTGV
jgi:hypothetical protein